MRSLGNSGNALAHSFSLISKIKRKRVSLAVRIWLAYICVTTNILPLYGENISCFDFCNKVGITTKCIFDIRMSKCFFLFSTSMFVFPTLNFVCSGSFIKWPVNYCFFCVLVISLGVLRLCHNKKIL